MCNKKYIRLDFFALCINMCLSPLYTNIMMLVVLPSYPPSLTLGFVYAAHILQHYF